MKTKLTSAISIVLLGLGSLAVRSQVAAEAWVQRYHGHLNYADFANGVPSPSLQWPLNGSPVPGAATPRFPNPDQWLRRGDRSEFPSEEMYSHTSLTTPHRV